METQDHHGPPLHREAEARVVAAVERFLTQVRDGGSLDPETVLADEEGLRQELEPLLLAVLRLEGVARRLG